MTLVWGMYADGAGDRNQLEGIARRLGWPYEIKSLRFRKPSPLERFFLRRPQLLDGQSELIRGPWPDLILVAGSATHFALEFRRKHCPEAKIVRIGRSVFTAFGVDLWIQTGQFFKVPWRNNVAVDLPFHLVTPETLAKAAGEFAQKVELLPRPRVALLTGGLTHLFRWSPVVAAKLAQEVNARVARNGGSILLTTSKRTGSEEELAILNNISSPSLMHFWSKPKGPNPFQAFLALADLIIVTEDSVSMIAEACATGKPVEVYQLDYNIKPAQWFVNGLANLRLLVYGRRKQLSSLRRKGKIRWFRSDSEIVVESAVSRIELPRSQDDDQAALAAIRSLLI